MKIVIPASGSRGDVQPYIALGGGLKAAGHHVRLVTSDDFETLVREAGLEFRSIGISVEQMLHDPAWRSTVESGSFIKIAARMRSEMRSKARELARLQSTFYDDVDLIVGGMGGLGGAFSIAEKFGLPMIQAYVFPLTPTRTFASPLLPRSLPIGLLNRLSYHVMRQMLWMTTNATDAETRRSLGLPSTSILGPFGVLKRRRVPVIYGYSRHVLPRPDDWDDRTQIAGYWFLDAPADWQPPADLTTFLQAGSPSVYVGFGSMGSEKPEQTTRLLLDALARTGQRAVLASGWGGLSQMDLPENIYMLSSVPHQWLFPRMAAIVHHGGAGTTAAVMRAGVPSLIVPHFGDQAFWGQRVAALGVGPAPIPRRQLTAERLAESLERMIADTTLRQRAADLGERIRSEDGIGRAVELIERWGSAQA